MFLAGDGHFIVDCFVALYEALCSVSIVQLRAHTFNVLVQSRCSEQSSPTHQAASAGAVHTEQAKRGQTVELKYIK